MSYREQVLAKAARAYKTIVFPEGDEKRTLLAAAYLAKERILRPVLLGDPQKIRAAAEAQGADIDGISLIDPAGSAEKERYAELLFELRKHKGMSRESACKTAADPMYYGMLMVKAGDADGLVSGAVHTTGDMLRPALTIIRTKPGIKVVSSCVVMNFPNREVGEHGLLVFSDCVVIPCPTSEELAQIAVSSAETAGAICDIKEPRVALLSFSTKGSAEHEVVTRVREAVRIAHENAPGVLIDGELQFDAALVPEVAAQKAASSPVAGRANVLIFPSLEAGNIGYKIAQRLGGAEAYAVLQGLDKPCNDLSRGCSVDDIIMTAALTALQ